MKKRTLKNGLRLITIPLKNTKVATVLILFRVGSKDEEKDLSGISHFLEHMFFKGTKKRKTPIEIAEELDKIGGDYNAFTSEDYTGYYAKVNVDHLPLAVDWVSDICLNSLLPENEVEKEKGVIKEEINMYYDNPMAYCQIIFQKLLYGDQPAGRDVAGTKETVSSIKKEDLATYMDSYYLSNNAVMVVAGNIKEKEAVELIEKYFFKMKRGDIKERKAVVEKQLKPEVLSHYKETDQTHLCLGVRAFNIKHKNRFTQKVLASILGGMMSSRLFVKIREELGLAYYVRTSVDSNPDTGALVTQAGVENKNFKKAAEEIVKEYRRLKREMVTPKELKKAKEHLKGKSAIRLESSDALSMFYGLSELLEGETMTIEEAFKEIDKVTPKDIQEVAKKIFTKEGINLAFVGPHKEKKAFEDILKKI